ncbi:oligosaccharyl transferase, archaeosortase A system-associated [Halococcoides cellulosivorans]|nr:oligosaccharyl transferase, archaeosortase A system-associated [Halococcoides cellulosivorans]
MSADEGLGSELADARERVTGDPRVGTAVDEFLDIYHLVVVGVAMVFVFWIRARNWGEYVVDGEVLYSGNDPWYHYRMAQYTVENFPNTMPYEVWTKFPTGTSVGQFGTLMDQVVALGALIVGLGSPDPETVRMVLLFAPAVFGTLLVVPVFLVARRLAGRTAGVLAVVTFAFAGTVTQGGSILIKGVVGTSDHHIAEALLAALAALAVIVALQVAHREKPVIELLDDRDVAGLRRPLGYGALAGAAIAIYMSMWPPAIYFVGLLGIYVTLQAIVSVARGDHPEPVLIVMAVTFAVTGLLTLGTFDVVDVTSTKISLIHVGLPVAGAVWSAGLLWLARVVDTRDLAATDAATAIEETMGVRVTDARASRIGYPLAVLGTLAGGALVAKLVVPGVFSYSVSQFIRVVGFAAGQGSSTIGEVQPLPSADVLFVAYGMAIIAAAGLVGWTLVWRAPSGQNRPERLFVAVWFVFSLSMTFTQGRFMYYLAVPTVTLAGVAGAEIIDTVRDVGEEASLSGYEVVSIAAVVVLLIGPLAVPPNVHSMTQGSNLGPGGGVQGWQSSLDYLNDETPIEGAFGTAENADELDYYGTYAAEADSDYDYPEGSFGVLSWWDYGHWITVLGERIPTANPFQEGANSAARFLLSSEEAEAESVMEELSDGENAETRYVAVDYKMALANSQYGGKFFAPPNFVDNKSQSDYRRFVQGVRQTDQGLRLVRDRNNRIISGSIQKPEYYHTMPVRLYRYHGSMREPAPVVVNWQQIGAGDGSPLNVNPYRSENESLIQWYPSMEAAQNAVRNDSTAQIGGIGAYPADRVPALEHYRLVNVSTRSAGQIGASQPGIYQLYQGGVDIGLNQFTFRTLFERNPAWTKIFERVPGATIQGEGPANSAVYATVEMDVPRENASSFRYTQRAETDAQGDFEMTVPYASTGTDEWGPDDGATNVSVRATGPYEISTTRPGFGGQPGTTVYNATADVSNAKVIGRDDDPVTVTLEPHDIPVETPENATDPSGNATGVENATA